MRFTEAKINHFGRLQGEKITFSPGINVICGENESGKSTLHAFLRAMLFGLRRGRGRASRQDAFVRYEPWENPGAYGGVLRFASGGKEFRLTRRFARGDLREELVCETDGERLDIAQGDLQMLLGEVSPAVFDNTVSVGQLRSRTEAELYEALQNYMANCQDTGDGNLNVSRALELLKARQRQEEQEERREQQGLLSRQRELESRLEYVKEEQARLAEKYRQERKQLEQFGEQFSEGALRQLQTRGILPEASLGEEPAWQEAEFLERYEERPPLGEEEGLPGMAPAFLALLFCLAAAGAVWLVAPWSPALKGAAGAVILLLGLTALWGQARRRKKARRRLFRQRELRERENLRRQRERQGLQRREQERRRQEQERLRLEQGRLLWTQERGRLQGSLLRLRESLEEKETEMANLQADLEECLEERNRRGGRRDKIEGLQLARETIEKLADSHRSRYGGELRGKVSQIMAELTGGAYSQVYVEEDFQVRLHAGDRELSLEQVSRGTAEQLYFALRMAAGEILCREESLPLLLDETFALYDDKRLKAALNWLYQNREQTLLFTCQNREEELLKELGIPYHRIELKKGRVQTC